MTLLRSILRRAAVLVVVAAGCLPTWGALLWQMGQFDRSSGEFRPWIDPAGGARLDYANPGTDPHYRVGTSPPGDWFAYQPGSANGGTGFRTHPGTITFRLEEARGRFRLTVALLTYSARLPRLQVEINGRKGWFYPQPELDYEGGDPAVFFLPHYARAELAIEVPSAFLVAGENTMVFTALDDPPERDDTRPAGFPWPGSSGLHYDAIKLERLEAGASGETTSELVATPFYRETPGGLCEEIEVIIRAGAEPARAVFSLAGRSWTNHLATDRSFGEWRWPVWVREFPARSGAELRVETSRATNLFHWTVSPARQWTLLAVPNVHLDIGYTDFAPKVSEIQSRILDSALRFAEEQSDFRYTPDGFWPVEEYFRGRGPEERDRLVAAVRTGQLSIPVVHSSPFTGFASLENLIRQLYPSRRFAREQGTPFRFALSTDVPNYSWSWASVLAASGVPYFVAASDAYRAPFLLHNRLHLQSPHWWQGPDGGRVLTWFSRHYHQLASLFGLPHSLANGRGSLPRFLQAYDRPEYRSDRVIIYGAQAENADLHPGQLRLVREWNAAWAYPRIQFAAFDEALESILAQTGTNLPVVRGEGAPYWEDGLGANARTTALGRQNMQRILSAEKLSTVPHLVHPGFRPDEQSLADAWRNLLLLDEHTWHADVSVREPDSEQAVRQGALKNSRAEEAERQIDQVLRRGLAALADEVRAPAGTVLVFNPLSWERSGWVYFDLPRGRGLIDPSTDMAVPLEVVHSGHGFDRVKFEAVRVPPVGYRCYRLAAATPPEPAMIQDEATALSNRWLRVELEAGTGRLTKIFEQASGAQWIDPESPYGFGEHLYVSGGDRLPNRLVQYSTVDPLPELTVHSSQSAARLVSIVTSPLGQSARITSTNRHTPVLETTVFLPAQAARIEISHRFLKEYTTQKEGVYFAFPFHFQKPRWRWATQNGWVDPLRDLLEGGSREWFLAHAWVELSDGGTLGPKVGWFPVDAPLFAAGDLVRGHWPRTFGARPATIFSYVMNNYTPEGYQAGQQGWHEFRYWLAPTTGGTVQLNRLGTEASVPLEINEITRNDKPPDPGTARAERLPFPAGSFLEIDVDHLNLITWKLAEHGPGTILRLLETGGLTGHAQLRFPLHRIRSATACRTVEDDLDPLPFEERALRLEVRPHQIITVRVELEWAGE